jgi:hypothetical protein
VDLIKVGKRVQEVIWVATEPRDHGLLGVLEEEGATSHEVCGGRIALLVLLGHRLGQFLELFVLRAVDRVLHQGHFQLVADDQAVGDVPDQLLIGMFGLDPAFVDPLLRNGLLRRGVRLPQRLLGRHRRHRQYDGHTREPVEFPHCFILLDSKFLLFPVPSVVEAAPEMSSLRLLVRC